MMSSTSQPRKERKGFEDLQQNVIIQDICTECAACYITCPFLGVLEYDMEPRLVSECKSCGLCLQTCPRYELDKPDLEKMVFGRSCSAEESYGVSRGLFAARSTHSDIYSMCQDGGVATTILVKALLTKIVDGAAISGRHELHSWQTMPMLAMTRDELVLNAGTRYTYSPNLLAFKEGVQRNLSQIAFVGTPCQIQAIRRIQTSPLKKYSQALGLTVGLFCSESFDYEGLMLEKIQRDLGIDLDDIVKMNIKGGLILYLKDKSQITIPLKELKAVTEQKCHVCTDFSAELADISVGGIGLDGWTVTVIRSIQGENVFNLCVEEGLLDVRLIREDELAFKLLHRLSRIKQRRVRSEDTVS
jgi:coenzyme F420 hydrogenase subunit beta